MIFHRFIFEAMACENELQFYAADAQTAQNVADKAIAEVRRIESRYSRYREDSIISSINRAAGKSAVQIDEETASLLRHADICFYTSRGLFDITSGVLRQIWNFRDGILPSAQAIAAILPRVGWDKVEFSGKRIRLALKGMEIDFGGIGKEYAADRAALILHEEGIASGLVNLGGDIRILGPHPDGSPWPIHIVHPRQQNTILTTFNVAQGALATSGDYQRYLDFDGKRYCHILNPRTGWPVSHWQSVSVVASQCMEAGSAATISMLLESEAVSYLQDRGASYLLVDQQGELHHRISPGQAAAL
jgi:thiamine biosynthesis lipoprotein